MVLLYFIVGSDLPRNGADASGTAPPAACLHYHPNHRGFFFACQVTCDGALKMICKIIGPDELERVPAEGPCNFPNLPYVLRDEVRLAVVACK